MVQRNRNTKYETSSALYHLVQGRATDKCITSSHEDLS